MRRTLALCLMLLVLVAANAFAVGEARITGKIISNIDKQPLADAVIKVEAIEGKTFKQEFKVKKDGTYAIFLLDGTLRYKFTFSAPGFTPYEETVKLTLGAQNVKDVALGKGGGTSALAAEAKADPAVDAYNTGAALANEGKVAEAIAKFDEALAAKPDLTAAWMALAKLQAREKNWPRAIEAANKALEVDAEDGSMWAVLYQGYTATGDKAKAEEAKKKMPANAGVLFNDAARAINAGNDAEAEPLLKQAIEADPEFAQAYYELGMVYVRTGNGPEAKANLEKYIEIEPTGKDVATAKEMLKYVK